MLLDRAVVPFIALLVTACSTELTTDSGRAATTISVQIDTIDYESTVSPSIVVMDQHGVPITDALTGDFTIVSSDTTIATVNGDAMTVTGTGIGDATLTVRYNDIEVDAPIRVRLGPARANQLIAGGLHSCVLSVTGAASCWGGGMQGELGNGDTLSSGSPVIVHGGHHFSSLAAGYYHSCGLEDGAAWCWGLGEAGVLGNGADTSASEPVPVAGGLTFVQITAGYLVSCGLTADGTAYCWGGNYSGTLGIGSADPADSSSVPVPVTGGVKFARITADGYHVCALTRLGKTYCWGSGWGGALGTGDEDVQPSPVAVLDSMTFVSIVGGFVHTCAIDREGRAFCWGYNDHGQVGDYTTDSLVFSPVEVQTSARFWSLSEGQDLHLCGIARSDGMLRCWGANSSGQLGDGTTNDAYVPVEAPLLHPKEVVAGDSHTCAIDSDDVVFCWGDNTFGQIGQGTVGGDDVLSPSPVNGVGSAALRSTARDM